MLIYYKTECVKKLNCPGQKSFNVIKNLAFLFLTYLMVDCASKNMLDSNTGTIKKANQAQNQAIDIEMDTVQCSAPSLDNAPATSTLTEQETTNLNIPASKTDFLNKRMLRLLIKEWIIIGLFFIILGICARLFASVINPFSEAYILIIILFLLTFGFVMTVIKFF